LGYWRGQRVERLRSWRRTLSIERRAANRGRSCQEASACRPIDRSAPSPWIRRIAITSSSVETQRPLARHGSSSVNGGRFTPPAAPKIGLYESTNGGASFTLVFSRAADVVDPNSANGNDFFRGGVTKIETDRTGLGPHDPTRLYFSVFDYGLFRSAAGGAFEQVFASGRRRP